MQAFWIKTGTGLHILDNVDESPAVIGAVIDLGYCFDLTDSSYLQELRIAYDAFKETCHNLDKELTKEQANWQL